MSGPIQGRPCLRGAQTAGIHGINSASIRPRSNKNLAFRSFRLAIQFPIKSH